MSRRRPSVEALVRQFNQLTDEEQSQFLTEIWRHEQLRRERAGEVRSPSGGESLSVDQFANDLKRQSELERQKIELETQEIKDNCRKIVAHVQTLVARHEDAIRRLEPLTPRSRKEARNHVILGVMKAGANDWRVIRDYLMKSYPELMRVKRTGKIVGMESMKRDFRRWKKRRERASTRNPSEN